MEDDAKTPFRVEYGKVKLEHASALARVSTLLTYGTPLFEMPDKIEGSHETYIWPHPFYLVLYPIRGQIKVIGDLVKVRELLKNNLYEKTTTEGYCDSKYYDELRTLMESTKGELVSKWSNPVWSNSEYPLMLAQSRFFKFWRNINALKALLFCDLRQATPVNYEWLLRIRERAMKELARILQSPDLMTTIRSPPLEYLALYKYLRVKLRDKMRSAAILELENNQVSQLTRNVKGWLIRNRTLNPSNEVIKAAFEGRRFLDRVLAEFNVESRRDFQLRGEMVTYEVSEMKEVLPKEVSDLWDYIVKEYFLSNLSKAAIEKRLREDETVDPYILDLLLENVPTEQILRLSLGWLRLNRYTRTDFYKGPEKETKPNIYHMSELLKEYTDYKDDIKKIFRSLLNRNIISLDFDSVYAEARHLTSANNIKEVLELLGIDDEGKFSLSLWKDRMGPLLEGSIEANGPERYQPVIRNSTVPILSDNYYVLPDSHLRKQEYFSLIRSWPRALSYLKRAIGLYGEEAMTHIPDIVKMKWEKKFTNFLRWRSTCLESSVSEKKQIELELVENTNEWESYRITPQEDEIVGISINENHELSLSKSGEFYVDGRNWQNAYVYFLYSKYRGSPYATAISTTKKKLTMNYLNTLKKETEFKVVSGWKPAKEKGVISHTNVKGKKGKLIVLKPGSSELEKTMKNIFDILYLNDPKGSRAEILTTTEGYITYRFEFSKNPIITGEEYENIMGKRMMEVRTRLREIMGLRP